MSASLKGGAMVVLGVLVRISLGGFPYRPDEILLDR
jgi:hypothetical protein